MTGLRSSWVSCSNAPEVCIYLFKFPYYLPQWSNITNFDLHAGLQEHVHVRISLDERRTPFKEMTTSYTALPQ